MATRSNFLEQYRAGIEKATADDVNRVAAKYLHKDQLAVLVVGNTKDFDKPLSTLGPVTNIDITIPPPPGEKPAAKAAPLETPSPRPPPHLRRRPRTRRARRLPPRSPRKWAALQN